MGIYVNMNAKDGQTEEQAMPRLFKTDSNGKAFKCKHWDIQFCEDGLDIQTDISDGKALAEIVKMFCTVEKYRAEKAIAEARQAISEAEKKLATIADITRERSENA